jgi:hypothetical protein
VADTGIGIPVEPMDDIFEPFRQAMRILAPWALAWGWRLPKNWRHGWGAH